MKVAGSLSLRHRSIRSVTRWKIVFYAIQRCPAGFMRLEDPGFDQLLDFIETMDYH